LQQILEQVNATNIFLKRLDGKIERLEHKIMDISTNKNNNIQTLNDDFLSYFPMKDITAIDDIEALITNDIGFKKNVVGILIYKDIYNICLMLRYIL